MSAIPQLASLYLEFGGDFQFDSQGSLLLAIDTPAEATSTIQRLQRLLFTCPRIKDSFGNILARGDSLFFPDYGAGLPSFVDATMTNTLLEELQATILDQISQDPGISRNPVPVVSIATDGISNLTISVTVTTVSGQVVTVPAYNLSGGPPL
jgi:phage baseplate assembly protein W